MPSNNPKVCSVEAKAVVKLEETSPWTGTYELRWTESEMYQTLKILHDKNVGTVKVTIEWVEWE